MKTKTVYGFDNTGFLPVVAMHTFEAANDGQLSHLIDGRLRATVPPEGWQDYCKAYPEAQDIVDALTIKPAALEVAPVVQVAAIIAQDETVSFADQLAALTAKIAQLEAAKVEPIAAPVDTIEAAPIEAAAPQEGA